MIHKELRRRGVALRKILPVMNEHTYRMLNGFCRRFLKGKWSSKRSVCNTETLQREDGTQLRVLIVKPLTEVKQATGLLWLHGGGYAMGVPELDRLYIERFVAEGSCIVIAPDYRLSGEAPYPAALEDCYLALKWLKANASRLGIREDQIFVGGESAGGGLAAALSLLARDKKEVDIAFQMLFYPMLDDRFMTDSSVNNDAPVWNTRSNEIAWQKYLGKLYGSIDVPIYAAPARCTNFDGLPPVCTFVGSIDPFCDETKTYVSHLEQAGIPTHFKVFQGAFHTFDLVAPRTPIAKAAVDFYMESFHHAVAHYFEKQK